MKEREEHFEDFLEQHESQNKEIAAEFFRLIQATDVELRETISYLIRKRERLRARELRRLEAESAKLLVRLKDNKRCQLIEEISCFKEILGLQRRLLKKRDRHGERE